MQEMFASEIEIENPKNHAKMLEILMTTSEFHDVIKKTLDREKPILLHN